MKAILIILIFSIGICAKINAQQNDLFSITPVEAGTVNLKPGKTTIKFSEQIKELLKDKSSSSYYVVFTPHDDSSMPSIADKNNSSFAISLSNKTSQNATVDYVVFLKQKVIRLSAEKSVRSNN